MSVPEYFVGRELKEKKFPALGIKKSLLTFVKNWSSTAF